MLIRDESIKFANMSIVTGVLQIILFILHFGLYQRPEDDKKPYLHDANPNIREGEEGLPGDSAGATGAKMLELSSNQKLN